METLITALKGSILELTENMVRLQWHLEATKNEEDASEKRLLLELILKLRDILAFIPMKKSKNKRKSETPLVGVDKFVYDSKNSMEDLQDRLQKLLALLGDDVDQEGLLTYAKNIKEAAKVFTEDFEAYLKTRPCSVSQRCELFVRVAEAKQLPAKDFTGTSDPFCNIIIDNEKMGKTQTIWKTLSPCWLRDFDLDIPVDSQSITFSVWDKDKAMQDEFIGERTLSLAALPNGLLHESWMSLLPKGYGKAIFSKAHIKVKFKPSDDNSSLPNLFVTLVDVTDLETNEAVVCIMNTTATEPSPTDQSVRTPTLKDKDIKDNTLRTFNEFTAFRVKVQDALTYKIGVFFYKGKSLVAESFLAVSSVIPLEGKNEHDTEHSLSIIPKPFKKLGELRVQLKRITYKILSSHAYDELLMLMLHDDETVRYISDLCENVGRRKDVIRSVVSVLADRGVVETFINTVTTAEINSTVDMGTLFRANSFSAICVDAYLNLVGTELLQKVLKNVVTDIYRSKKSCEMDTSRFTKALIGGGDTVEKNLENLKNRVTAIWVNIQGTVDDMPRSLRSIFANLQDKAASHWPSDPTVRYLAPSGFLFLRFFCAAVLGPHLFQLTDEYPENKVARNLTLISKTLMNLGNLVIFGAKEPFLVPINDFIQAEIPRMKLYIDTVAKRDARGPEPKPNVDYEKEMSHIQSFLSEMTPKIEQAIKTNPNVKLARLLAVVSRLEASLEVKTASAAASVPPLLKKRVSTKRIALTRSTSQKKKSRRSLSASAGGSSAAIVQSNPKRNSDAPTRPSEQ